MSCVLHGVERCPLCDPPESLEDWIVREARAISGPRSHLQDSEAVIQFGLRVAERVARVTTPRGTPPPMRTSRHNIAISEKGTPLPFTPEEVTQISMKAMEEGEIMVAVLRLPAGDLAVQVFSEPSQELVGILETTLHAYRTALKGH